MGKKEKHGAPDARGADVQGDCWDTSALDPEPRWVVSVLRGKRTTEHVHLLGEDFDQRTEGRLLNRMTSAANPAEAAALWETYGEQVQPRRKGQRGRRPAGRAPRQPPPKGLTEATVPQTREKNRVVRVERRVLDGTVAAVVAALTGSSVRAEVHTVFVERHNGTDRNRNARKVRKTDGFFQGLGGA